MLKPAPRLIADLHLHSRYSRACSREITPEVLCRWGQLKGLSLLGTGDFSHPLWLDELRQKLEPAEGGLLRLREGCEVPPVPDSCRAGVHFLLSTEISCIYHKGGRTRKVHALVLVPDFAAAGRLNRSLARIGNLAADGRPILKLDVKTLLELVLQADDEALLIPAHAWTPHFSLFGSVSGFDTLEECFEELTPRIHAIETGLSSDPAMNRRLSMLDNITLVSNSDAHSPARLGREATIFTTETSYTAIARAIRTREGYGGTIEFYPQEGKYHADGHRSCGVCLAPAETAALGGRCPVCGGRITVGVLNRVEQLADRPAGYAAAGDPPYRCVIPLAEIIAGTLGVGIASKRVTTAYFTLLERLGTEFAVLLDLPQEAIAAASTPQLATAVMRARTGEVTISAGYDGRYGSISVNG